MKISGIYKIQSIIKTERCYIGSAKSIHNRWLVHLNDLKKGVHHSKKLQRHFNKYGKSDLVFSVIIGCDQDDLISTEQFFIDSIKPYFNNSMTAGSNLGLKRGPSWNKGIKTGIIPKTAFKTGQSPWNKGCKATKEPWNKGTKGIMKAWNKGKKYHFHNKRDNTVYLNRKVSEATRQKCREGVAKRPPISDSTREIMRQNKLGNKNMLGKSRSEETKKRVSDGLKRYYESKKIMDLNLITNN